MDKDYSYTQYVKEQQEKAENKCDIPMREQRKVEVEMHDLFRLER